jgi:hypothetical protein
MRISNSFSDGEIQVMEFIVQTLLRGGTPTMAVRHKEFASLCRKVMAMKAKVHERPQERPKAGTSRQDSRQDSHQDSHQDSREESSVGTVSAPAAQRSEDLATAV